MTEQAMKEGALPRHPLVPFIATIQEIRDETPDVKTYCVVFDDPEVQEKFTYMPGQFLEVSVLGVGESTFGVSYSPTRTDHLEFSVKRTGKNTSALHQLEAGEKIGVRGPYGNNFPVDEGIKGKDLLIIGGGIGMAPLRSLLLYVMDHKEDYGKITVINGARSKDDLVYKYEFEEWAEKCDVRLTIDREQEGWDGHVGFVPSYVTELAPSPRDCVAFTCGPPIMIKFVLQALRELGFKDDQIVTTLEMRMKCGMGKCGRCNIGHLYVCFDGPVFTMEQLAKLPAEY